MEAAEACNLYSVVCANLCVVEVCSDSDVQIDRCKRSFILTLYVQCVAR